MKVALVCIAKNEDHYIDEWIEYHKKLGFNDIFIYENNWEYKGNHDVKCIPVHGEVMQIPTYNIFMRKYEGEYDWAAFIDVDEFIVLKEHNTIQEFISLYGGINSSIAMNWVLFGDNGHESVDGDYSVIRRFTKRQTNPNEQIKVITKVTSNIQFTLPHCTSSTWMDTNGKTGFGALNINGPIDVIQLNHYFCKTQEEFQDKINRGRADTNHPVHQRTMNDFKGHNFNAVEALEAYNRFYNL